MWLLVSALCVKERRLAWWPSRVTVAERDASVKRWQVADLISSDERLGTGRTVGQTRWLDRLEAAIL